MVVLTAVVMLAVAVAAVAAAAAAAAVGLMLRLVELFAACAVHSPSGGARDAAGRRTAGQSASARTGPRTGRRAPQRLRRRLLKHPLARAARLSAAMAVGGPRRLSTRLANRGPATKKRRARLLGQRRGGRVYWWHLPRRLRGAKIRYPDACVSQGLPTGSCRARSSRPFRSLRRAQSCAHRVHGGNCICGGRPVACGAPASTECVCCVRGCGVHHVSVGSV